MPVVRTYVSPGSRCALEATIEATDQVVTRASLRCDEQGVTAPITFDVNGVPEFILVNDDGWTVFIGDYYERDVDHALVVCIGSGKVYAVRGLRQLVTPLEWAAIQDRLRVNGTTGEWVQREGVSLTLDCLSVCSNGGMVTRLELRAPEAISR